MMHETAAYGTTAPTFRFNHLKNYFGVPLAEAHGFATGPAIQQHVIGSAGAAKQGAIDLNLIDTNGDLTTEGVLVVEQAVDHYGSVDAALERFDELKGTTKRFVDIDDGVWDGVAQQVVTTNPAIHFIVDVLVDNPGGVHLPGLVHDAFRVDSETAETVFIRDSIDLPDGDSERAEALFNSEVYRTTVHFQLKTMLYHAGLLTRSGSDSNRLVPQDSLWELENRDVSLGGEL